MRLSSSPLQRVVGSHTLMKNSDDGRPHPLSALNCCCRHRMPPPTPPTPYPQEFPAYPGLVTPIKQVCLGSFSNPTGDATTTTTAATSSCSAFYAVKLLLDAEGSSPGLLVDSTVSFFRVGYHGVFLAVRSSAASAVCSLQR